MQFTAVWETGGIIGPNGVGYFGACLEGESRFRCLLQFTGDAAGLADAQGAEIHLIVRSHCAAAPAGTLEEQILGSAVAAAVMILANPIPRAFDPTDAMHG